MSAVEPDVLACGILLDSTNDFGRTVQAVWIHDLALRHGITPQDTKAVYALAQRKADTLTPAWREHCTAVARSLIGVFIEIKHSDYRPDPHAHPADCLYCAAGEGSIHTYQPPD